MRMVAIDGFTGAGGMADGMLAAGFEVVGIDTVRRKENRAEVMVQDIRQVDPRTIQALAPVWVHLSPPCQRFSLARAGRVADPPTEKDLELLEAGLRLRDAVKPRFWSVENVRGSVKWFRPILGEPRLKHGPFYFWGNFPPFLVGASGLKKGIYGSKSPTTKRLGKQTKPKDPWLSARLPIEITRPMAEAVASATEGGGR